MGCGRTARDRSRRKPWSRPCKRETEKRSGGARDPRGVTKRFDRIAELGPHANDRQAAEDRFSGMRIGFSERMVPSRALTTNFGMALAKPDTTYPSLQVQIAAP